MGLDKFSSSLDLLLGFNVNLYIGEDIYNGKLIGVETDYIIVENENNYVFYYSIDQIQAITKNTKLFQSEVTTTDFIKTQSLTEVLNTFRHSWVTILCLNKQKFNGILGQVDEDFATLINGEERILIKLTHISNILKGFINEEETNTDSTKASSQSNAEKGSNAKTESDATSNESNKKAENKSGSNAKAESDATSNESNKKAENKSSSNAKAESDATSNESNKKAENKSGSSSKEDNSNSAKSSSQKEKSKQQQEVTAKMDEIEPNNTMVWSKPIKIEATMVQSKDEFSSNILKTKKSTDLKKSKDDMGTKDSNFEEVKSSKSKSNEQPKEMNLVKESVFIQKTDNEPAPPFKLQNSEVKSSKTQEATKPATKKTENTITNENSATNNSQNVWKQREKEQKVFRFAGELVGSDNQRAFPFAGWPNRNNQTSRF
jgi:hypothetical protein